MSAFKIKVHSKLQGVDLLEQVRNIADNACNKQENIKKNEIISTAKKRKITSFDHILRNEKYKLVRLVIQKKIQRRRRSQ